MTEVRNPHDAFARQFLSRPEAARDFLANYLPPQVVAQLDLTTLALQKDSFIGVDLQEQFSDLLYRIQTIAGQSAFVYLLFEHKSYPDPWVVFQLLRYKVRAWEKEARESGKLSPIIPLVLYHGRAKWTVPTNFGAMFPGPKALQSYWPQFHYHLVDLSTYTDDEIRGDIWSRLFLLLLKHIFDGDFGGNLVKIFALMRQLTLNQSGLEMLETMLRYVARAGNNVTTVDLHTAIDVVLPKEGGVLMKTLAEQWIEEGIVRGREEGIVRGREEGLNRGLDAQRKTLSLILQRRFQPSPAELTRIEGRLATITDLEQLAKLIDHALLDVLLLDFTTRLTHLLHNKE
jgi:predicted transposase/invertase (TIGR01784 family)